MPDSKQNSSNTKITVAIATIFFAYGFIFSSWASRIPTVKILYSLSEAELGFLLLALPIGSFLALPVAGVNVSRYGSKRIVLIAGFLYCFALAIISYINAIIPLSIMLFLFGFMSNLLNISINTQAVSLERIYLKNIMATFHGMWSVAGLIGAVLGAAMMRFSIGLQLHFLIASVIALVSIFLAGRFLLEEDTDKKKKSPIFVLPNRSLLVLGLIAFCSMMCEGAMFDWSGVYFEQVAQAPTEYVGLAYTFFMITMALTRFIADYFKSKFGMRKVIGFSGLFSFLGLLGLVVYPNFYFSLLSFLLIGVGVSSVVPLVFSAAGQNNSMQSSMALAAVSTMGFFGFLLGPPIIGFLGAAFSLRVSFGFLIFIAAMVAVLSFQIKPQKQ